MSYASTFPGKCYFIVFLLCIHQLTNLAYFTAHISGTREVQSLETFFYKTINEIFANLPLPSF